MTDPTSGVGSTTATTTSTSTSTSATDTMGKDTFLKLLVAQMKYQNPMSPTDPSAQMSQMAAFSQVEKLDDIEKSQTELATWQRTVAGQGMIGKSITATDDSVSSTAISGVVTGLKLTDAGPRLTLDNGQTVDVSKVTSVTATATTAPTT